MPSAVQVVASGQKGAVVGCAGSKVPSDLACKQDLWIPDRISGMSRQTVGIQAVGMAPRSEVCRFAVESR